MPLLKCNKTLKKFILPLANFHFYDTIAVMEKFTGKKPLNLRIAELRGEYVAPMISTAIRLIAYGIEFEGEMRGLAAAAHITHDFGVLEKCRHDIYQICRDYSIDTHKIEKLKDVFLYLNIERVRDENFYRDRRASGDKQ
jgi:hypothetical protein